MCFAQFFGDQSPFQIIVAVVAFVTAIYTLYKSFFERARIYLFPGDRVGLVLSSSGCTKFHLRGSLVNHAVKAGTLHRLEARITTPSNVSHSYKWNLFFAYIPGKLDVQPAGDPIPLSVAGKSSQRLLAEFVLMPYSAQNPAWSAGRYKLEITGWVNKKNRSQPSNLASVIHFSLDEAQATIFSSKSLVKPAVFNIPVEEWGGWDGIETKQDS
jgi:hypothetical protein